MIVATDLTKWYGPHRAVEGLNFQIPEGVIAGFLGPNGAGKTTTMRVLAGALAPTSGAVRIAGIDIFEDPLSVQRQLGYLPERAPLYDDMTVTQFLTYAARLRRIRRPGSDVERVLGQLGLHAVKDRVIGHLSKGFRQRVGLAQAMVHQPRVILLDEPASGLDPAQRVEMRAWIRSLAEQGATVLLSTHVLAEVEAVCSHVVIIHQGRIVADQPLDQLAAHIGTRLIVRRPDALLEKLHALQGVGAVRCEAPGTFLIEGPVDLTPKIARLAAEHDILHIGAAGGLEEAYLRKIGDT